MRIIINLDQHQAIQDFTVNVPAGTYEFKTEDTIDFWIYYVRGGVVQDLGAGFSIKYGMIKTGDPNETLLAYQTAVTYSTDPNGRVYYLSQVNFNTAEMASAIGTSASIACTMELRYQTTDGEKIHTLNIPALVFATILKETGLTPPNVDPGYPDASQLELLARKDQPSGYAGLDSAGKILISELTGVTELVANKGQPNGYPNLDATALIPATEIPIDGSTIIVTGGKITAPFAGGDMKKSVYDANNDGIVDHAALADSATTATNATTAAALSSVPTNAPLSLVWGQDAAGNQKLFVAPSASGGGVASLTDAIASPGQSLIFASTGVLRRLIQGANITLDAAATPGGITISAAAGGAGVAALTDAETATGQTLIYNSTGVLKRLIPTDGSIVLVANPQTLGIAIALADAETTAGITLLGSTNGTVKRLIAGANITLDPTTTPGGVIVNGAAGGAGVAALTDAETSAGVTIISSSTGVLKRLVAGSNITLTPDSPTVGGVTIAASGAGVASIHAQVAKSAVWGWSAGNPVTWQSANYDSTGMWNSSNPSRLTVATAGYYHISAEIEITLGAVSGSNANVRLTITLNGSGMVFRDFSTAGFGSNVASGTQIVGINAIVHANAGQYFEIVPYAIGTATAPTNVTYNSFFQADFAGT